MIGGFADRYLPQWGEEELGWFEALLEEQDVDVMAWAIGKAPPPSRLEGGCMQAMRRLDYIGRPR